MRLQIIDAAERLEAPADSLGEIGFAVPLAADSRAGNRAVFSGSTDTQPFFNGSGDSAKLSVLR